MRGLFVAGLTFLLACVLTAREALPATASGGPVITRQTVFAIPFTFDPLSSGAHEVQLYVSGDRGRDWVLYQRQRSSARRFVFRSGQDGEYWFAVRTLGSSTEPVSVGTKPDLRVIVDSTQPKLDLTAKIDPSGGVDTRWFIGDLNLDPSTVRLEYQTAAEGPWQLVNIDLGDPDSDAKTYHGKTIWWPKSGDRVATLRGEVRDHAGNTTTVMQQLDTPATSDLAQQAAGDQFQSPYPAKDSPSHDPQPMAASIPWPGQSAHDAPVAHGPNTHPWQPPTELGRLEQRLVSARQSQTTGRSTIGVTRGSVPDQDLAHADTGPTDRVDPFAQRDSMNGPDSDQPRTAARLLPASMHSNAFQRQNRSPAAPSTAPSREEANTSSRGEQPRACRSRRFQLDYEVDEADQVGLAGVELWYTTNGGDQWVLYGEDHDKTSPFAVQLDHEDTYGFRLVLRSADGLAGRPPRSGDRADMRIHADWTAPTARLTSAQYGSGEQLGKLVIQWEASDRDLADRPVSLYYTHNRHGTWTAIATGLADTGQYAWHVDQRVPRDFFLRLQVIDRAGNVAEDQLLEPISSDGLAPKGYIRSVRPLDEPDSREAVARPDPRRAR